METSMVICYFPFALHLLRKVNYPKDNIDIIN